MMTRKDYILIANVLKNAAKDMYGNPDVIEYHNQMITQMVNALKAYGNFDEQRFRNYIEAKIVYI